MMLEQIYNLSYEPSSATRLISKLMDSSSVHVDLCEPLNNQVLNIPIGDSPLSFYTIPERAFILPDASRSPGAFVFPYNIPADVLCKISPEKPLVGEGLVGKLFIGLELSEHTCASYAKAIASEADFESTCERIRKAEDVILARCAKVYNKKHGYHVFSDEQPKVRK